MISPHIRDRFFQRYGQELTVDALREIINLARVTPGKPDPVIGRERVSFVWQGHPIVMVWSRPKRYIFTFLPPEDPGLRLARSVTQRQKRRRR